MLLYQSSLSVHAIIAMVRSALKALMVDLLIPIAAKGECRRHLLKQRIFDAEYICYDSGNWCREKNASDPISANGSPVP